jgi:hypothetical protein
MECSLEDFPEAFAFPVQYDGANGEELLAVETSADRLFLADDLIDQAELMDDLESNEVVSFAACVEYHFECHV